MPMIDAETLREIERMMRVDAPILVVLRAISWRMGSDFLENTRTEPDNTIYVRERLTDLYQQCGEKLLLAEKSETRGDLDKQKEHVISARKLLGEAEVICQKLLETPLSAQIHGWVNLERQITSTSRKLKLDEQI